MNGKLIAALSVVMATLTLGLGYAYMGGLGGTTDTVIDRKESNAVYIRPVNDPETGTDGQAANEPFMIALAPTISPAPGTLYTFGDSDREALGSENDSAAVTKGDTLGAEKAALFRPVSASEAAATLKPEPKITTAMNPEPEMTSVPKPTPKTETTSKPAATPKPTPKIVATSKPAATPKPTPKATAAPKPTEAPKPTQKAEATPEPTAAPRSTPRATATPVPTPKATATPIPTAAPNSTPKATAAPKPTDKISDKTEAPDTLSESMPFIIGGGEARNGQEKDTGDTSVSAPTSAPTATSEPVTAVKRIPSFAVSGDYDWESLELAARVAYYEAGSEAGRKAVLNVILNRCRSKEFGGKVTSVEKEVYRKSQFSVVRKEEFETFTAPDSLIRIADAIFNKGDTVLPENIVFFRAAGRGTEWDGKDYYDTIGGNAFFSAS